MNEICGVYRERDGSDEFWQEVSKLKGGGKKVSEQRKAGVRGRGGVEVWEVGGQQV